MNVFSKRQPVAGQQVAERIQQEIMDSVSTLHKCDNFHFGHLLVVMYEADQIRWQVLRNNMEGTSSLPAADEELS